MNGAFLISPKCSQCMREILTLSEDTKVFNSEFLHTSWKLELLYFLFVMLNYND